MDRPPLRVEIVAEPQRRTLWRRAIDLLKDVSVAVTALLAIFSFLPDAVRDPVLVWYGDLDGAREDVPPAGGGGGFASVVEPLIVPGVDGGVDKGAASGAAPAPSPSVVPLMAGWSYGGDGEGAIPWIYGRGPDDVAVGAAIAPVTDVYLRRSRVTGANRNPEIVAVIYAGGEDRLLVRDKAVNERTNSLWLRGDLVPC